MSAKQNAAASILLSVKGGLLMAFGPEGDPVPPRLIDELCSDVDGSRLRLRGGAIVDSQRALALFEAQSRGSLADRTSNRWVESFLGHVGSFEPTPQELLDQEPDGDMPPQPASVYM